MATKGSKKARSVEHEDFVAGKYGGKRNASSGAAPHEAGDVCTPDEVFECKMTGSPGKICAKHEVVDCEECMRTPTLVQWMEKVWDEACEVDRDPVVCLRYYAPHSPIADSGGWVDLTVRLTWDDAIRSDLVWMYKDLQK